MAECATSEPSDLGEDEVKVSHCHHGSELSAASLGALRTEDASVLDPTISRVSRKPS